MNTAKIIVIDGGANIGKATQADMLMHRLMNEGYSVGKMDFPRYNQNTIGHLLNEGLEGVHGDFAALDPKIVATLYAADRYESRKQIMEWIEEGRVIIFDRYVSANKLHQGAKISEIDQREEFFRWVDHVEHEIFGMPRPNVTIYLDVPSDDSHKLLEYVEEMGGTVVDPTDKSRLHQAKVSECARFLGASELQWETVACLQGTELRPREDIHEDIYAIVKKNISDIEPKQ